MSRSKEKARKRSFQEIVALTEDIKACFQPGLKALGTYASKIKMADPRKSCGSVDIDKCVKKTYPQQNRWDYAICYDGEVYFVEIHSAYSGEVSTVLKKLQWLKDWLVMKAPELNNRKPRNHTAFYWIQSNGNHILPSSKQARQIALKGLKPISVLNLG